MKTNAEYIPSIMLMNIFPLLILTVCGAIAAPSLTLERNPSELDWKTLLLGNEANAKPAEGTPPRRITTKSLFIAPERESCREGYKPDSMGGCVKVVRVNENAHLEFLLQKLNEQFATVPSDEVDISYDYETEPEAAEASGPFQLSLPLDGQPDGAPAPYQEDDTQTITTTPNSLETTISELKVPDKKATDIIKQLESLKLIAPQEDEKVNTKGTQELLIKTEPFDHTSPKNKPLMNTYSITPISTSDSGQKEMILEDLQNLSNVSSILSTTGNDTFKDTKDKDENAIVTSTLTPNILYNTSTTKIIEESADVTTDASPANKNQFNERYHTLKNPQSDKSALHPEVDYSDIGEAIKIISRYAEVSTDDMFTNNDKRQNLAYALNENPLGTRTKLSHLKKPANSLESASNLEYDYLAKHDNMRRTGNPYTYYYHDNKQMPVPYPDVSKRVERPERGHVNPYYWQTQYVQSLPQTNLDFWTRGMYSRYNRPIQNPIRHHHYYYPNVFPGQHHIGSQKHLPAQNYRRARRLSNDAPAPLPNQAYSLLGMKHWINRNNGAER